MTWADLDSLEWPTITTPTAGGATLASEHNAIYTALNALRNSKLAGVGGNANPEDVTSGEKPITILKGGGFTMSGWRALKDGKTIDLIDLANVGGLMTGTAQPDRRIYRIIANVYHAAGFNTGNKVFPDGDDEAKINSNPSTIPCAWTVYQPNGGTSTLIITEDGSDKAYFELIHNTSSNTKLTLKYTNDNMGNTYNCLWFIFTLQASPRYGVLNG